MGWVTTVLGIIKGILDALPIISRWFKKSATERAEEKKKDVRDKTDSFRKDGRPKWD